MGGDYTRFTFDPVKGFSGVLKQQGRVSLDSDANENEEILDRRDRAEMYDTVGHAVYPLTTPDAFKIGVGVGGALTIGQGRFYLDGILAECFGDMTDPASTKFDERLNDLVGKDPLGYDRQPFFYSKPAFPALSPTPGTINLVYLDVWQREVTVFEDYALREIALNGPDTDTRVQTAWQVKVMKDAADAGSCVTPPAAWKALVAPSTARLTAATTPTAPAPGPCVINPAGGYTGLENRLYRVEVHTAGTVDGPSKASFKWSRDNASLAARVTKTTKVTATDWIITVGSTGRDAWMRFEFGDHVELLDDDIEFAMRETGTSGILARVTSVNHATGEIHVDQDLTALPIVTVKHPRIRRWDVASAAEPFARPTSLATPIALESGISVTFGPAATDTLHAGDYWVFAARTADGSIDLVDQQPPRNTLHHFAQLALVTSGAPPVALTDCRIPWPPAVGSKEGCCTEVVKVGEDIQKAIDRLDGIGGCVCLKMGVHLIRQPLRIKQSNLTLHGEAPLVTVRLQEGGPLVLEILPAENVHIEGVLFEVRDGRKLDPMISVNGVTGGHIANCALRIITRKSDPAFQAIGIALTRCRDYGIESVEMRDVPNGIAGRECELIRVLDCALAGPGGTTTAGTAVSFGMMGIVFEGRRRLAGILIERNLLDNYQRGIQLGDVGAAAGTPGGGGSPVDVSVPVAGCRIIANLIMRRAGVPPVPQHIVPIAFAIAAHVSRCEIVENAMNIETLEHSGILVVGGNMLVHRNEVRSTAAFDANKPLARIPIGVAAVETLGDVLLCSIRGNLFTGLQQAVHATGAGSGANHRVDILDNRIVGVGTLVAAAVAGTLTPGGGSTIAKLLSMIERFGAIVVSDLSHCRIADNEITTTVCGIACGSTMGTSIVANRVSDSLAGVLLVVAGECEVSDNILGAAVRETSPFGVGMLFLEHSVVARNAVSRYSDGLTSVFCSALHAQDNDIYETQHGIASLLDTDLELRGNNIEDAALAGITALFALHELTLVHDRALRCGYRSAGTSAAFGIDVMIALALVTVEGCHVIDTGEAASQAAPAFTGQRHGIRLVWALGARVRGCEVVSKALLPTAGGAPSINVASRAVRMWTIPASVAVALLGATGRQMVPFADATDNVIEQSVDSLVEIIARGEIMFATNRCLNFAPGSKSSAVILAGESLTVTGNRVRAEGSLPALTLLATEALSAIGNITSSGAIVASPGGAHELPAPYATFNVAT